MTDLGTRFRSIREAPSPDLWHEIEQREPRPGKEVVGPLRKLGVVALAFLVASFGIGVVIHALKAGPKVAGSSSSISPAPKSPTPPALSPLDPKAVTTVPVSSFPEGIAVGERGVWVVAGNGDGSGRADIARLDPRTGDVVARVPNVPAPGWEFGGGGIATGAGSLWVVGNAGGDVVLTQ